MWEENFGTQAGAHLKEGVRYGFRLIQISLNSQLGAKSLASYTPSHMQRALLE